jgi:hypothetical protein
MLVNLVIATIPDITDANLRGVNLKEAILVGECCRGSPSPRRCSSANFPDRTGVRLTRLGRYGATGVHLCVSVFTGDSETALIMLEGIEMVLLSLEIPY